MNGEEPDKKQDVKVKKPIYGQEYYFINSHGWIECDTWQDTAVDNKRWELANVFLIRDKAVFAVEKRKVEVELQRYAEEHNDPDKEEWNGLNKKWAIEYDCKYKVFDISYGVFLKCIGQIYFSTKEVVEEAIEAVGKERILKYIFGVESEEE